VSDWLIPVDRVVDGGPGRDGIPSIDNPLFVPLDQAEVRPEDLVIGIKAGDEVKAIPHDIMDWHEVLNDHLQTEPVVLSYCPLTGSALLWKATPSDPDVTFGVSGLLFNSNLILFDRETGSHWLQMRGQSVEGLRRGEMPETLPLVETRFDTWQEMYPNSLVLSRMTGFTRSYDNYPYNDFRSSPDLLFAVEPFDTRLFEKTRVLGVQMNNVARAYEIQRSGIGIEVINDSIDGVPIVVVLSASKNFGAIFERTLDDGTVLTFSPSSEPLPTVMTDDEGNTWDVFGEALTGLRTPERLPLTKSHTAYWYAWAAFHPGTEIHDG